MKVVKRTVTSLIWMVVFSLALFALTMYAVSVYATPLLEVKII